jgi:hypothetical protein
MAKQGRFQSKEAMYFFRLKNLKVLILVLICLSVIVVFISNDRVKQINRMIAYSLALAQSNTSALLEVVTNPARTTPSQKSMSRSEMDRIERELLNKKFREVLSKNQNKSNNSRNYSSRARCKYEDISNYSNSTNNTGIIFCL